jgi:hypothetical protein
MAEPVTIALATPPPPARTRPAHPAHHAPPAAPGFVNIYADPWASVAVDGKPLGSTPLAQVPLAPGVHRVRLRNPKSGTVERLVRIASGKTELIDVDLDSRP